MSDRHALGGARRPRGEDDPRVVAPQRRPGAPAAGVAGAAYESLLGDHPDDVRLAEHQRGPLVGVVGVHRHVGGACGKGRQDRHVEGVTARRHADSDAVAAADAAGRQPRDAVLDVGDQLAVGELDGTVVDRGRVGVPRGCLVQDVGQRAWLRGRRRSQVLRRYFGRKSPARLQRTKRRRRRVCHRLQVPEDTGQLRVGHGVGFSLSATVVAL